MAAEKESAGKPGKRNPSEFNEYYIIFILYVDNIGYLDNISR